MFRGSINPGGEAGRGFPENATMKMVMTMLKMVMKVRMKVMMVKTCFMVARQ